MITEHPSTALRKEVDELKVKVARLEKESIACVKAILTIAKKNDELTELVVRTLRLMGELERFVKAPKEP